MTNHGQCRCGKVRLEIAARPLITMACHCTGCQQMTASAFSLSTLYPSSGFRVVEGEPVIGGLHGSARHFCCPYCMSWLFTRLEGRDDLVNVRATMLDDARAFQPFVETWTSEMLPWAKTPARHSFERFPPMEQFPALLAEFAALEGDERLRPA
jgi:hypothetical protein